MPDLPAARTLLPNAPATTYATVILGYDERLLRRKRLITAQGEGFLVDLPAVTNLDDFWGFELADGRTIQVEAAEEPLLEITGPDLPRLAWHIGNRHTPCQMEPARLLIRQDHVLEAMLHQLGAAVARVVEPFTPEGGAYGTGRTMGHSHGPELPEEAPALPAASPEAATTGTKSTGTTVMGATRVGSTLVSATVDPTTPAVETRDPTTAQPLQSETFGWHDHGDGKPHFHAPKR